MLKLYPLIFLVLVELPGLFSQSMTIDEGDIISQMLYLSRQCDQISVYVEEYEKLGYIPPDDVVVFNSALPVMKQMQIEIISASCIQMRAAERGIFVENPDNNGGYN